ncbi:hypothetical protein AWC38_SpisGene21422 [Stylophora pistillata]|uniref:Integrase catalytic domain-containing protein n=1 Tax=Stylophora pistillata TaxID=50429 RepID=A0A2B4RDF9_STYPI|nr:hypothetical protein AWC38_SpisGene21422 [Stylophora pistillata]
MNNSVFGKTMENIRKRVDVRLLNNRKKAQKLSAKPNFKHCTIFDENLIAIHMGRTSLIKFDKPVFCGMAILDLSKTLMYDFHYNYTKKKYGDKAKLFFTVTDSLMYEIETEDFYKDIAADVEETFDTCNFPKDHNSKIPTGCNKIVLGMIKDEAGGKIIEESVGLRAKLYSYKILEGKEEKKCKGIKKTVIKKNITHEDYKIKVNKYALTVVDVASRFKAAVPLTSKESSEVSKAFQTVYKRGPLRWPEILQVDPGREFMGETTKEMAKDDASLKMCQKPPFPTTSGVQPFQFQPSYDPGEEPVGSEEEMRAEAPMVILQGKDWKLRMVLVFAAVVA